MRNGAWTDWIDRFLSYTDGSPSPSIFRLWAGIGAVAGALERRVWAQTARSPLYPNLFTLLVSSPGGGKTVAINPVQELWYATQKFCVAANSLTRASLVDALAAADRKIITPSGLVEYHSLLIAASEFGVLVPAHDLEFLSVLNYIFDNPKNHREERRTLSKKIDIVHPQLNILAGSQPGFLAALLPEEAWTMGFTSRLIMVYSGETPDVALFDDEDIRKGGFDDLVHGLIAIASILGPVKFSPESRAWLESWRRAGYDPVPLHSKLQHYIPRRVIHVIKLAMVSAISRSCQLDVSILDLERGKAWLLAAEARMPDIFREMTQRSDSQVIQELHFYAWQEFQKSKQPIHKVRLLHFLSSRCPVEKIDRVLSLAEHTNIIVRQAGTEMFIPRPRQEHGVE